VDLAAAVGLRSARVPDVQPPIQYTTAGGATIAFQVVGDGPVDLIVVPGFLSHVEASWDDPVLVRFNRRLAACSRLILFDKRGQGLSDPLSAAGVPDPDGRADEIAAVLDAVGSRRAFVLCLADGVGGIALAVRAPDRVRGLVLVSVVARMVKAPDYPFGLDVEAVPGVLRSMEEGWGRDATLMARWVAPSRANDPGFVAALARMQRRCATPSAAAAMFAHLFATDLRPLLPRVAVPTLVLHRAGDRALDPGHARYLADHIPGARLTLLPGTDSVHFGGGSAELTDALEAFVTGERPAAVRLLRTLLFTDIVGSTAHAAAVGDQHWRETLDRHDAMVRREIERAGGHAIDFIGDGLFAAFEDPLAAIGAAEAIVAGGRDLGLAVRAGLHLGLCQRRDDGLAGMAVHVGARVGALAGAHEVLVTQTVREAILGSDVAFEEHSRQALKGVPGEWTICRVVRRDPVR
jgi:class 3 adenylate cyclase